MSTDETGKKVSPRIARHFARWRAVQALYSWDLNGDQVGNILRQFRAAPRNDDDEDSEQLRKNAAQADMAYFEALMHGVPGNLGEVDAAIEPHIDRALASVDPIERAILRMAFFELMHRIDVPYRVVINEAVELTKEFGAEQGHKFVNGVLDKASKVLRAAEVRDAGNRKKR